MALTLLKVSAKRRLFWVMSRAAERWERWERVPSQFEILAAILADDLRTFVAK